MGEQDSPKGLEPGASFLCDGGSLSYAGIILNKVLGPGRLMSQFFFYYSVGYRQELLVDTDIEAQDDHMVRCWLWVSGSSGHQIDVDSDVQAGGNEGCSPPIFIGKMLLRH